MDGVKHTCKSCGHVFMGNYCNQCGEKVYTQHDKSIMHLLEEGFHFITHFEGTFLVTLKTILLHPGKLTLEYCHGIRKKYFKPLSFFLLLVVLYLIFPVFKGLNMTLENHMSNRLYASYATEKVNAIMLHKNWSIATTTEHFHAMSEKVSKFLIFIIIPVMALFNQALLYRKRKPFFDHFIFSTEMTSFFLLWGFLLLPALILLLTKIIVLFGGGFLFDNEGLIGFLLLLPFLIYTTKAFHRFYGLSTFVAFLFALLFVSVMSAFVLTIYKFILFFITIHIIH